MEGKHGPEHHRQAVRARDVDPEGSQPEAGGQGAGRQEASSAGGPAAHGAAGWGEVMWYVVTFNYPKTKGGGRRKIRLVAFSAEEAIRHARKMAPIGSTNWVATPDGEVK